MLGFAGVEQDDSEHMYTALLTIYLITIMFAWNVLQSVLTAHFPKFDAWRADPL